MTYLQPRDHHLAQLNVGRLNADVGDPLVADFIEALDLVNGIGKRSPGFVWMMEGSGGPGNTDAKIGGDPRFIANLTVWEDVRSLEAFVWKTVHRQFYARRAEWFEALEKNHLVFWWVPVGRQPSLEEALERLDRLESDGPSLHAFGWDQIAGAEHYREATCAPA